MNSKVSILMPCYNAEKYIGETLQCLLSQDYENIEIIVVDDGSTDNSYDIAKTYECDRVAVLKQPNSGACTARNLAFEKSTGDYIMFMDADDLISSDQIAAQMAILDEAPDGYMAFGRWARFHDSIVHATIEDGDIYHDYNHATDIFADLWNGKSMMPIHSYIIPRSIIGNERFNPSLRINQDGEFLCRIITHAKGLKFCSQGIAYYRRGHASISTSNIRTFSKQRSRLDSFISYEETLLPVADSPKLRKVLARNYSLIACAVPPSSQLFKESLARIKALGVRAAYPYPKTLVGRISAIIGLPNALRIRHLLSKFTGHRIPN